MATVRTGVIMAAMGFGLVSCRPGAVAAGGADGGALFALESTLWRDGRTTPAAQSPTALQVLRSANRLPRVAFAAEQAGDGCLPQGGRFGAWTVRFDGYGCVRVDAAGSRSVLHMGPKAASRDFHTHAPLVLGPTFGDRLAFHARIETVAQVRREGHPNPWEVAWVVWQYQSDERFYYFIPKPNGWELGKRDPAYPGGQRFLASGTDALFPIGRVYDVTVVQVRDEVAVFVDGREIARVRDPERPYHSGRIGIYSEDAEIRVHGIRAS